MENNKKTKTDTYKPTRAEMKIMDIQLNPEYLGVSVMEKCKIAGVSRAKWYEAMANEQFVDYMNKTSMDLLRSKMNDVINATYRYAISSSKNSMDRKMLLTMGGLYTDKQEVKADIDAEHELKVTFEVVE